MSNYLASSYSAQLGVPQSAQQAHVHYPPSRYEQIVTTTFNNACQIARSLCRNGEQVLSVQMMHEGAVVDVDAITVSS